MPSSELPLDVPACTCSLSVTLYRNKLVIDSWGECYERKSWSGNDRMRDGCHQCLGLYLILANTLNLQHLMGQELKRSRLCFKIFAQKHQFCSFSKPFKKNIWRRRMKAKRVTWNSCHGAALLLPILRQMRRRTFMKLITQLWTVVLKWHPKCHCETQLSRSYESCTICIYWSVLKSGQLTYCFWLKLLHHDEKPLLQSRRWMKTLESQCCEIQ